MFQRAPSGTSLQGFDCAQGFYIILKQYPRSNKNSPKQEIGRAPNTSERHHENIEVSTENKKETVPVYRGSGMDDKVVLDVVGEEKIWEVEGEESPSGCPHAKKLKVEKEKAQEAEKPVECPFSHIEL